MKYNFKNAIIGFLALFPFTAPAQKYECPNNLTLNEASLNIDCLTLDQFRLIMFPADFKSMDYDKAYNHFKNHFKDVPKEQLDAIFTQYVDLLIREKKLNLKNNQFKSGNVSGGF